MAARLLMPFKTWRKEISSPEAAHFPWHIQSQVSFLWCMLKAAPLRSWWSGQGWLPGPGGFRNRPSLTSKSGSGSRCLQSAMGRRKAGAGGGHAAVLSAGAGWEARRAAGLGVRPETAAEATGRPPGFHWGPSVDWPFTGSSQSSVDWRGTRRSMRTGRAGTIHSLKALKSHRSGERLGVQWQRGGLGAAIHWWSPNHTGLESGSANNGGVAGWEQPRRGRSQSSVDRRAAWQTHKTWQAGSSHSLCAPKAVWFTGGWWRRLFGSRCTASRVLGASV